MKGIRIAVALAIAALTGVAAAQETLRIGAINPYSGPLALYGDELARGYQLAVDERNAKGGVLGRKIELDPRRRHHTAAGYHRSRSARHA